MKKLNLYQKTKKRIDDLLKRRPHRSFRLTRRRDYKRSLDIPKYMAFTKYVWTTIWTNRKILGLLALFYAVLTILMVGIGSQDTYDTLKETLNTTSGDYLNNTWGEFAKAGLLFVSSATGNISSDLTDVQMVYAGIIALLAWLTAIWLLRNILAGHKVKLRDGLYSAGSPIVATFLVALLFIVQLLPAALALIAYSAASSSGLLTNGIEAMLFWVFDGLLMVLSLYWMTSTFFAMIIITLPGMYPMQAIKMAGDLVIGRRLRILLRLVWMFAITILVWAIIMIPLILFDGWIKGVWTAIASVPIIPVALLILSSVSIIWISSYIYLLYRKVVADESNPA